MKEIIPAPKHAGNPRTRGTEANKGALDRGGRSLCTRISRVAALAMILLLSSARIAAAQQSGEPWTSPDGLFSVAIPARWEVVEGVVPGPGERLLAIQSPAMLAHRPVPREVFFRECAVRQEPNPLMRKDQGEINTVFEDGKILDFLLTMAFPSTVHSRSNEIVQRVRVLSYDIDINASRGLLATFARAAQPDIQIPDTPPVRLIQRMFAVPAKEGAMQYFLICYATYGGDSQADIEAMSAFLASLTFNR